VDRRTISCCFTLTAVSLMTRSARVLARDGFDISAAGTAPPAITAALEAEDWEGAVRTAICLGGDTDTLACIAGAVAEAVHGLRREIADAARAYLTDDLRMILERFELAVRISHGA
jgi:ADP-ribosylglycohydrolase